MTERILVYSDQAQVRLYEFQTGDTFARAHLPVGVLLDNAAGVPFTPTQGLVSTNTQAAIGEVTSRYAGGRRLAYVPYVTSRSLDRVQRIHRTGSWIAGDADDTDLEHTHGAAHHSYPFMAFTATDARGHPHQDHDRLNNASGPDVVTTSEGVAVDKTGAAAGFCDITKTGADWPAAWGSGDYAILQDWTNPENNLYAIIESRSGTTLTVRDPLDVMVDESTGTGEVRGTQTNTSGFNGYEEGLFIPAGTLFTAEERVQFRVDGFLENELNADAFVEFCVEPNHVAGVYAGANRMRCLSGQLGATWTASKRFTWTATFSVGAASSGDEYHLSWMMDVEDVGSAEGYEHKTSGAMLKTTDVFLGVRFRVDRIANLDVYDDTYQGTNQSTTRLRLEAHKYDAEIVH